MPVYKIAIAGASSLLSRELKDVLSESPLAASNFALLDEEEGQGQLEQVGDEVTFIQAISADAFDRADFTFFCGSENLTRRYWQQALRAGSTVLDLSGALDQETGVLIRAPWLGTEAAAVDLFTPAIVPAHPAVIAIALLLERLQQAAPIRFAAATVLEPASEFGRAAMDELHQQTVNLLNFQSLPRAVYDAQAAFNMLGGMGEEAQVSLSRVEDRIRRHYEALTGGRGPALAVQVLHAPVFHGHTFSIAVELERSGGNHGPRRGADRRAHRAGSRRHGFAIESGGHGTERSRRCGCALSRWAATPARHRGSGSGPRPTICASTRKTPCSARWTCGGCGRRGRCSKTQ